MRDLCQVRDHGECACAPGSCRVQPSTAPIIQPSKRSTLAVVSFGVVMACMAYLALSEADRQFRIEDIKNQEVNAHVYRR